MLHDQLQWVWGLEERTVYCTGFRMSLGGMGASVRLDSIIWLGAFYLNRRAKVVQKLLKKWVWGPDNLQWITNSLIGSSHGILWKLHWTFFFYYSYQGWKPSLFRTITFFSEGLHSVVWSGLLLIWIWLNQLLIEGQHPKLEIDCTVRRRSSKIEQQKMRLFLRAGLGRSKVATLFLSYVLIELWANREYRNQLKSGVEKRDSQTWNINSLFKKRNDY